MYVSTIGFIYQKLPQYHWSLKSYQVKIHPQSPYSLKSPVAVGLTHAKSQLITQLNDG